MKLIALVIVAILASTVTTAQAAEFTFISPFGTAEPVDVFLGFEPATSKNKLVYRKRSPSDHSCGCSDLGAVLPGSLQISASTGSDFIYVLVENNYNISCDKGCGRTSFFQMRFNPPAFNNKTVTLYAGDGDDVVYLNSSGTNFAWAFGGNGFDRMYNWGSFGKLYGEGNDDVLWTNGQQGSTLDGGSGNDCLDSPVQIPAASLYCGSGGSDTIANGLSGTLCEVMSLAHCQ